MNKAALSIRDTNPLWQDDAVSGIGPTRSFYFISNEVIRADDLDGFNSNERPMVGKPSIVDGTRYIEFDGFICANRRFKVRIPTHKLNRFLTKIL